MLHFGMERRLSTFLSKPLNMGSLQFVIPEMTSNPLMRCLLATNERNPINQSTIGLWSSALLLS